MTIRSSNYHPLLTLTVLALSSAALAQTVAPTAASLAPLGLQRLQAQTQPAPDRPPQVASAKFAVDALAPAGAPGATKVEEATASYLALETGATWSRPLRGPADAVTFATFLVYGSLGTTLDIGGARLGFVESPVLTTLALQYAGGAGGALEWHPLGLHVSMELYGGRPLAAPTVLTVRLDPASGTWDLFSGSRLLVAGLPLAAAKGGSRQFTVTAGLGGAWVAGLVLSDENPLYEDANANGLDDRFEQEKRGTLLAANATADRTVLAKEWQTSQRRTPTRPLHLTRPPPDGK